MKTKDEIIREQIGISIEAGDLTPMDKGECKICMEAYLKEKLNNLGAASCPQLGEVPNITDDNIQELREIILDSNSSKTYQNRKIREWIVRHLA